VVKTVRNLTIGLALLERDEMRPERSGELERRGLLPPESLTGGESEK
jgi:hypothetical protein